jgi:hypothetical protein
MAEKKKKKVENVKPEIPLDVQQSIKPPRESVPEGDEQPGKK